MIITTNAPNKDTCSLSIKVEIHFILCNFSKYLKIINFSTTRVFKCIKYDLIVTSFEVFSFPLSKCEILKVYPSPLTAIGSSVIEIQQRNKIIYKK